MEIFADFRHKIGFCLVFSGVSLGMLLNFYYPVLKWSPVIMFLSICCLWGKSASADFPKWNKHFKTIAFFMILMLIYRLIYDGKNINYANKVAMFQLYILSLCYVFNRNHKLSSCNYIPVLIIYTSILSIIFAIMHYTNMFSWEFWQELGGNERVLEVFTANASAFINMVACLVYYKKGQRFINVFLTIMIVVDMYVIMQSGKRSYFVAVFVAIVFLLYKYGIMLKSIPYIFIGTILLFAFVPAIRDQIFTLVESTINGFTDVYGTKNVAYDENSSSSLRAYLQKNAIEALFYKYGFLDYIFGAGYIAYFTDNPLLESYMDMGIAGFIFYVLIIIVNPIKLGYRIQKEDKNSLFAFLVATMNIVICITNNDPYIYIVYTPVCVLALYYSRICNIKNNKI